MSPQENTVSPQQSLEQKRAQFAWNCIGDVKEKKADYANVAKKAPSDIQINGLGQTLAFWRAKGKKDKEYEQIYNHVSKWVLEKRLEKKHPKGLLGWVMSEGETDKAKFTTTDDYRRATTEAIAFLVWLKRFAEAELDEK